MLFQPPSPVRSESAEPRPSKESSVRKVYDTYLVRVLKAKKKKKDNVTEIFVHLHKTIYFPYEVKNSNRVLTREGVKTKFFFGKTKT